MDALIQDLAPQFQKLESERRKVDRASLHFLGGCSVLLAIAAGVFFTSGIQLLAVPPALLIVGSAFIFVGAGLHHLTIGRAKKNYALCYKDVIVSELVSRISPDLMFEPSRGIAQSTFRASELHSHHDRYESQDLVHGVFGRTQLSLAEVHAERSERRRRKRRYVTVFQGLLLVADFHKHFQGRTFAFPDTAERSLGRLGRSLQAFTGPRGTKLVQMEDSEFEREFAVYTDDQVEARYILSPAMMQRIMDTRRRFARDIRLSFKGSCLFMAIPYPASYLEPDSSIPANEVDQIKRMDQEVRAFLDIVNELDLNTRIWTKS